MSGYTKLFNSILASTVWSEPNETRIVWITLLAMADKNGIIEGSVPGLAVFARLPVEDARIALERLSRPDEESRSKEHEGRRIEAVDGGWRILNHSKYRAKLGADERREYNRVKQAQHRDKVRNQKSLTVNDITRNNHKAEAEATPEASPKATISNKKQQASLKDGANTTNETKTSVSARSKRPIFTGTRFVVFEWQLDDLRRLLGKQIDEFFIDEWFHDLNKRCEDNGEVIPQRDGGKWLQEQTLNEARRRGLIFSASLDAKTASTLDALTRFAARGQA